jgi:hypothetical protein
MTGKNGSAGERADATALDDGYAVERLMKRCDVHGVRRDAVKRAIVADSAATRLADLVQRRFGPTAPSCGSPT